MKRTLAILLLCFVGIMLFAQSEQAVPFARRGMEYSKKGDHDRAIAEFTEAVKLAPDWGQIYSLLALSYNAKGDYDKVIANFTEAIRLGAKDARIYELRGAAYYHKGDYEKAFADWEAALRIDPNNSNAKAYLERFRAK